MIDLKEENGLMQKAYFIIAYPTTCDSEINLKYAIHSLQRFVLFITVTDSLCKQIQKLNKKHVHVTLLDRLSTPIIRPLYLKYVCFSAINQVDID